MDFTAFRSLAMPFAEISKACLGFSTPKCVETVIKKEHSVNKSLGLCAYFQFEGIGAKTVATEGGGLCKSLSVTADFHSDARVMGRIYWFNHSKCGRECKIL